MVKVIFNDNYLNSCGRVFGSGAQFVIARLDGSVSTVPFCLYSVRQLVARVRERVCSDSSIASVVVRGACGVLVFCVWRS